MNTEFKGSKYLQIIHTNEIGFGIGKFGEEYNYVTVWGNNEESKANANLIIDAGNTIQSCGLLPSELLKQNKELQDWKDSAMKIMCNIDLQKVGKLVNVRLGDDISTEILPFIEKTLKQRDEMKNILGSILFWGKSDAQTLLEIKNIIESNNP